LTRGAIESEVPAWKISTEAAMPDEHAVRALAEVSKGATIDVYLGTWCSDSQRELSRLWKALDMLGEPPFSIRYIKVDRHMSSAGGEAQRAHIKFLPTFVVRRHGIESGRVVESAPAGIERDLGDLLSGRQRGTVSRREDL